MSQKLAEELLPRLRQRYMVRGREGRSRLIDELCEQWGYSRKHPIKLLGAKTGWGGDPGVRKGRPPKYDSKVGEVLRRIWKVAEQPCGKRLKALLPQWLPYYEGEHGRLGKDLRSRVLSISAAQADRLLAARKSRVGHRGRCGTKPGGLLKTQIPMRTDLSARAPRASLRNVDKGAWRRGVTERIPGPELRWPAGRSILPPLTLK